MSKEIKDVTFVTYSDHSFLNSKALLCQEAYNFGFRKFSINDPTTLPKDFLNLHHNFFQKNKRGAGYWLWKSCIVWNTLNSIDDGEFLLYADAGCAINENGKERFNEWIKMADENNSLSLQMHHLPEKHWSKMNLVNYLGCNKKEYLESGQINATIFLLKKCDITMKIVKEWFDTCSLEWTIDDSISQVENDPEFKEHRHDQSVFSLVRKKYNSFTIHDESYPELTHDWNDSSIKNSPILAMRRRF